MNKKTLPIILGSLSPRRKEILSFFSIPFEQITPNFDEEAVPFDGDPIQYATTLARGKGESLSHRFPKQIILTADTIVFCNGKLYGKPNDDRQAFEFLKELSGRWHSVFTAVNVILKDDSFNVVEETKVLFSDLSEEQIHTYYKTLHYSDKAGGYAIQGAGGIIVERIEGCYYNVMGLPIQAVRKVFKKVGIDLWNYLK